MKKQKRNYSIVGIILILIIVGGVISFNSQKEQETIKIGALYPLTGGLAEFGEAAQHATELAIEDINNNGGINGNKLVVEYQDHQCDSQTAKTIFEQMNKIQGINVFSSAACSGTVLTVGPLLGDANSVWIGTIVTNPSITGVSPNLFRNWAADNKQAVLFSDKIKEIGWTKLGIINEETDYARGLRISLEQDLKETDIQISGESFVPSATDVRTQITKLQNFEPDCLFISPQTVTAGDKVLKQMTEMGFNPETIFVNEIILKSTQLLGQYPILEGSYGADYLFEKNDQFNELMNRYKDEFGVSCPQENICAGVYDAINILAKAMKEVGDNPQEIRDYIKTIDYDGISGDINFDSNNDRSNADYTLFRIENKTAVQIK